MMYLHTDLTNIYMHTTAYPYIHITAHLSSETNVLPFLCPIIKKTTHPKHKTNLPALSFSGGFDK